MIPPSRCDEAGSTSDGDLIEIYREVANVLSRLADAALPVRVRLDPAIDHPGEATAVVVATGSPMVRCEVDIEGYGTGRFGIWQRA